MPLLTETYEVDIDSRTVLSMSSGIPAEESIAVLILHYLMGIQKQQGFSPSRDWISFREVEGGISFLSAFQESVIKLLIECLGIGPDGMIRDLWKVLGASAPLSCGHHLSHVCQIWMRAMRTQGCSPEHLDFSIFDLFANFKY
ncbi:DUF3786 domain-containing protein [Methanothrix sp.]|uniref:DUF3786 domain-containing protein n=1 Tax=Methanothrix sp. TaxID=90426 RepID=UPI003BB7C2CD